MGQVILTETQLKVLKSLQDGFFKPLQPQRFRVSTVDRLIKLGFVRKNETMKAIQITNLGLKHLGIDDE